jgi:hypothetical protein
MPSPAKKTIQMSKPKSAPVAVSADEKRIIAGGDDAKPVRLKQLALYLDEETVARLDRACGSSSGMGMSRAMWLRRVTLRALDEHDAEQTLEAQKQKAK